LALWRPPLAKEWGLTKGALGPVFLRKGLFGLMDRRAGVRAAGRTASGRKNIIIFSTLCVRYRPRWSTAFVQDVNTLLRDSGFLTGLGLGGAMPNTIAMDLPSSVRIAAPRHHGDGHVSAASRRARALGGLLAAALISRQFGWRSVFWSAVSRPLTAGADPGAAAAGIGTLSSRSPGRANARVAATARA